MEERRKKKEKKEKNNKFSGHYVCSRRACARTPFAPIDMIEMPELHVKKHGLHCKTAMEVEEKGGIPDQTQLGKGFTSIHVRETTPLTCQAPSEGLEQ